MANDENVLCHVRTIKAVYFACILLFFRLLHMFGCYVCWVESLHLRSEISTKTNKNRKYINRHFFLSWNELLRSCKQYYGWTGASKLNAIDMFSNDERLERNHNIDGFYRIENGTFHTSTGNHLISQSVQRFSCLTRTRFQRIQIT